MADVGVRPARHEDVARIAEIQIRAWRIGYAGVIPTDVLADMTGEEALPVWRDKWDQAVTRPPSARHRVLVAVDHGEVVGFTAHAPAEDPDHDPEGATELLTLLVDPERGRHGHGSRLLAATADLAREDGVTRMLSWVFQADSALRHFLEPSGWGPDGAMREVDMGRPVPMVRLVTDLGDS